MSEPVSDLPRIGAPAQRALANAGITTLARLAQHTESEIGTLHSMGPKALSILREALAGQGLTFRAA